MKIYSSVLFKCTISVFVPRNSQERKLMLLPTQNPSRLLFLAVYYKREGAFHKRNLTISS